MPKKSDSIFFENLVELGDCACRAADFLVECMKDYDVLRAKERLNQMHRIENAGDCKKHEMTANLAKAFMTPIDREDLDVIGQSIDEVTDGIEKVLQGLYMYRITSVPPEALPFAKRIAECCQRMKDMLAEFCNFKKPVKLHRLVVDLNHKEEECDRFYIEAVFQLPSFTRDTLKIASWREIYDRMKNCIDACEHVGDTVDLVVMKSS